MSTSCYSCYLLYQYETAIFTYRSISLNVAVVCHIAILSSVPFNTAMITRRAIRNRDIYLYDSVPMSTWRAHWHICVDTPRRSSCRTLRTPFSLDSSTSLCIRPCTTRTSPGIPRSILCMRSDRGTSRLWRRRLRPTPEAGWRAGKRIIIIIVYFLYSALSKLLF